MCPSSIPTGHGLLATRKGASNSDDREGRVAHIPEEMKAIAIDRFEEDGAMPADAITALCGLDEELGLREGESLVVFGASGGLGHMAVQLAKRMGARVLAVASGDDGVELVRRLGADAAVDGHGGDVAGAAREFAPDGIDAALVTASGEGLDEALAALKPDGRIAHPNGVESPSALAGQEVRAYDGRADRETLDRLVRLIEAEPFTVKVDRTFSLADASRALDTLDEHYLGKLALRVDGA